MIVSTLIAATVAAAEPTPAPQPATAPAPAEKKMACCEKMASGEGCDCCKDMDGHAKAPAAGHEGHGGHQH